MTNIMVIEDTNSVGSFQRAGRKSPVHNQADWDITQKMPNASATALGK
ncbi:MAG TPA: hypothetical protein V6D11_27725 [Waterburya sp.]